MDHTDKIFLGILAMLTVALVTAVLKDVDRKYQLNQLRKEAVQLGIADYKIVDPITGQVAVVLRKPQNASDVAKISKWLQIPLYDGDGKVYGTYADYDTAVPERPPLAICSQGQPLPVQIMKGEKEP